VREQTTRDLRKYVGSAPVKRPDLKRLNASLRRASLAPAGVYPMCEFCGVRDEGVGRTQTGFLGARAGRCAACAGLGRAG
jgi:hypothetical protein